MDFKIRIREPGRRTGVILIWLIYVGGSVWLLVVAVQRDAQAILLTVAFIVGVIVLLTCATYSAIRPRIARIDDLGIMIRIQYWTSRIPWQEIESVEIETVPELRSRIGRYLLGFAYNPEAQGQAVR